MWSYALKRAGATVVTLVAASVLIFAFIHLVPGDPIYVLLGDTATPDQVDAVRHELGLDQPIVVQYIWLGRQRAHRRSRAVDLLSGAGAVGDRRRRRDQHPARHASP